MGRKRVFFVNSHYIYVVEEMGSKIIGFSQKNRTFGRPINEIISKIIKYRYLFFVSYNDAHFGLKQYVL